MKALEVTDDYGVYLTELTLDCSGQVAVRQLAAVMLKQYIDCHWSQVLRTVYCVYSV